FARSQAPELERLILAGRQQVPTIATNVDGVDGVFMSLDDALAFAGLHIPDANGSIASRGNQPSAVAAELDGGDAGAMPLEDMALPGAVERFPGQLGVEVCPGLDGLGVSAVSRQRTSLAQPAGGPGCLILIQRRARLAERLLKGPAGSARFLRVGDTAD